MARKKDENQSAFSSLEELLRRVAARDGISFPPITPDQKDTKAVAAGKQGGHKGGRARAKRLSATRRKQIASRAAKARWAKDAG